MLRFQRIRKMSWTVSLAVAGCGGGGSGEGSTSPSNTSGSATPVATFGPANAAERAFFSDSYEFIGSNGFGVRGYVRNTANDSGDIDRSALISTAGSYVPIAALYVFQAGHLSSTASNLLLDPWVSVSAHGTARNDTAGSYVLAFSNHDWFSIQGIQEVDIAGKPFDNYYSAATLGTANGVFPIGAKAYVATWLAKQDFYLAAGLSSVFARPASEHYFLDYYNTATHAYCVDANRGLVFDSPTHATSYPIIAKLGTYCSVDTTRGATSHVVTSHQTGTIWFFDFTNNQIQMNNFLSDFTDGSAVSTQNFAAMVEATGTTEVSEYRDVYAYPTGSRAAYLATSGLRLNKVALNALLAASTLATVP